MLYRSCQINPSRSLGSGRQSSLDGRRAEEPLGTTASPGGPLASSDISNRDVGAEQRDELAPFQLIEWHSVPTSQGRFVGYRTGGDQSAGNLACIAHIGRRLHRARKAARDIMDRPSRTGCACSNSSSTET